MVDNLDSLEKLVDCGKEFGIHSDEYKTAYEQLSDSDKLGITFKITESAAILLDERDRARETARYHKERAKTFLIAFSCMTVLLMASLALPAHASPSAARALERLEGMREGTKHLNKIMGVNTRRTPWCGHAAKYAVRQAGKKPPKNFASARAWERFGRRVKKNSIRRGDVVVFRSKYSKSGRHVAIATAVKKGKVKVCGGNTRNRVHCGWRAKSKIVEVRR